MWKKGTLKVGRKNYTYWIKKYEEPSCFGIEGGRISKLTLSLDDREVANYDRGWDIEPEDKTTRTALEQLLRSEN